MLSLKTTILSIAAPLLLASSATSGVLGITTVAREGDPLPGGAPGNYTRIDNLAVNSDGTWLVEADTDAPTDQDQVLVRDGVLLLRELDALDPAPATLSSFDTVRINDAGDSGWNIFLDGLTASTDSGLYFNTSLLIQESEVATDPVLTPGTPYIGFFESYLNNANQMLVVASIDDPAIASTVDRALVVLGLDDVGNLVSQSVFAKEGDVLPGQVEPVADFGTGPHQTDFNDAGQILYIADMAGSTAVDVAVYLDNVLLAQEGSPSPIAGRNWQTLSSRSLTLNNAGQYAFKGDLDGDTADDEVIVRDGVVFRQHGDVPPGIGAFQLTSFGLGSGPLRLDDCGRLLWYGDWDDPNLDVDTGLFIDDELIIQEGVTVIDGIVLDTIASGQDSLSLSNDGRWLIFEGTLVGGIDGAFLVQLDGEPCGDGGGDVGGLCPCDGDWSNHGEYVSCVAHAVNDLRREGVLTGREGGAIKSEAARSDCGR